MLQQCGIKGADLLIACTSRDESNLIAAMMTKKLSPDTKVVARTTDEEYLDVWRERQLDVDLIVSSEHETAHAIGFLGHTSDGGLMDPDGGNGQITPLVSGVLTDLYSLAPGTSVNAQVPRFGLRRPGGKNVLTFLQHLAKEGLPEKINLDDEITRETLVCAEGDVVHARVKQLLEG